MKRQKLRVLLDLSLTLKGYSGIPQDTRLIYKTLASCPDVEVAGLIYPERMHALPHQFRSRGASLGEQMANQAVYLWALSEGAMHWPAFRPWRILKKIQHFGAAFLRGRGRLERLEVDKFWHTLWRLSFAQTLSADDIPLVQNGEFLLGNFSAELIHLRGKRNMQPIKLDTRGYDFLIVQSARPFRLSPGTRHIVRYHDMIPVLQPDTRPNWADITWHHQSLRQCRNAFYVCNSEPTRDDLTRVYPEFCQQSTTIPYTLSDVYRHQPNLGRVRSIIASRRSGATGAHPRRPLKKTPRYIMSVSTLEPRKNFAGLIQAFNVVKARDAVKRSVSDLKLLIVGGVGWKFEPILASMRAFVDRGDLIHLEQLTPDELQVLYSHAEAFVFPSHAEGFGFPPLEAMQCDVPVIASDIAEHRWVLGDSALYCNSYDTTSIADAIERLVASNESASLRTQLIARGRERVKLYSQERCSAQWLDLLQRLKHGTPAVEQTAQNSVLDRGSMDRAA